MAGAKANKFATIFASPIRDKSLRNEETRTPKFIYNMLLIENYYLLM